MRGNWFDWRSAECNRSPQTCFDLTAIVPASPACLAAPPLRRAGFGSTVFNFGTTALLHALKPFSNSIIFQTCFPRRFPMALLISELFGNRAQTRPGKYAIGSALLPGVRHLVVSPACWRFRQPLA
jgi:hypothetical protein